MTRIQLSGVVDVETVVQQRDELVRLMEMNASHKVEIDLGELEIHGTAVITLLISALREARNLDKELLFKNCPESLLAVATTCGVAEILSLEQS